MREEFKYIIFTLYDKLVKIVKPTKENDSVFIENIESTSEMDLRKLIINTGLCKIVEGNTVLTLARPLILSNIKCKTLSIQSIDLNDTNAYLMIQNSSIDSLWIHSCKFRSLKIEKSFIPELTIIDSNVHENVLFDFSEVPNTSHVRIDFEDTIFRGDVLVSHLKMINQTSQFFMSGGDMEIYGDFILYQSILLCGKFDFSCNFKRNFILRMINSIHDENQNQILPNMGDIAINGGEIVEDLILEDCHLNSLSIANTPVGGTREFEFTYNILKNSAAIVLRDGASKKNNTLLVEKYTADMFDTHLKDIAIITYKKWISLLNPKQNKVGKKHRRFHSLILEPIELLIPSLTSSEGLILWLNKYSNDFNRSWIRGVRFTLIITLLSYFFLNYVGMEQPYFVLDLHFNGFGEVVKGYLLLLDVFNLTGISDNITFDLSTCGYILLFLAKILITYGYWQTIYAFFRYRK